MFISKIENEKGNIEYAKTICRVISHNEVDIELQLIWDIMDKIFSDYTERLSADELRKVYEESWVVAFQNYCQRFTVEFTIGNLTTFSGSGKDFLCCLKNGLQEDQDERIRLNSKPEGEEESDYQNGLVNDKFNPTY